MEMPVPEVELGLDASQTVTQLTQLLAGARYEPLRLRAVQQYQAGLVMGHARVVLAANAPDRGGTWHIRQALRAVHVGANRAANHAGVGPGPCALVPHRP